MSCPTCGSNQHKIYLTKRTHAGDYTIVTCGQCGLLYLDPMPSAAELAAYYNNPDYFHGDEAGYEGDYTKQRASIEHESQRRLNRIEALVPKAAGMQTRVLDFGCAAGYFLGVAQHRGWDITGIELAQGMAAQASTSLGITVHASFNANDFAPASFDAITLWEVIEHLPEPRATLKELRRMLNPGGVLALSTPNTGHWQAQHKPDWWSEFKPPAHVVFYTEQTLGEALRRVGFERIAFERTRPIAVSPMTMARLHGLRDVLGDGADRRTPLWPLTSGVYRAANALGGLRHRGEDAFIGLEAYAQP